MNAKKLTFTTSFFVVFFLALGVQSAYAHIPSHNPYGIQSQYHTNKYAYEYCDQLTLGSSYTESQIEKLKGICRNQVDINSRAQEMKDKKICEDLRVEIRAWRELIDPAYKDAFSEERIQNDVQNCYGLVARVSFLDPIPSIQTFDTTIFFISSGLSLLYLLAIFWLKSIRGWKLLLPIAFQVVISAITIFFGAIIQLGTEGPILPPVHDFLFFQQTYWMPLLIVGTVSTILSFALIRLGLLIFKKETVPAERRSIGIFYTLVFNPFFFPVGYILGLINLIHANNTSRDTGLSDKITP